MGHRTAKEGHRVLILAPYGKDAESVGILLHERGYDALCCSSLLDIARHIDDHVGVILITEEGLADDPAALARVLTSQPDWSDIPFVLLAARRTSSGHATERARKRLPDIISNVVVLERPLSVESLMSSIASAMKSRQKQFEMRDRLAELDFQNRRLNVLLEQLPVGVAFVDADRSTLISNPAFRRFAPKDIVPSLDPDAMRHWEAYGLDGQRIQKENFAAAVALRGIRAAPREYLYRSPELGEVWTTVSAEPLIGPDGKVSGAVCVIVDIDKQKQAQKSLALAADKLEKEVVARTADLEDAVAKLQREKRERAAAEASLRQSQKMEAVGQLTGGIAHDFNNMLTGVIGSLDIMKRRLATGRLENLDRFMDAASSSAQRAAALTQRLLAFSRRQSLDTKAVDVNQLVTSLEDLLHRTMSERVKVSLDLMTAIPLAKTDVNQLESALLNLAINARDAMPDGGDLTIETSLVDLDESPAASRYDIPSGKYIAISVSDTGAGIPPEILDKVYEPFFTTKPIGQGTGLGLSMIYGFMRQSGGQVRIHSEVGRGTSVKLFLPISSQAADEQPFTKEDSPSGSGQIVLVVEDDASVRLLIEDVLVELGYKAVISAEPQEAIRLLSSTDHLDLMISDVGLPGMNGRQLAELARARHPNLPILFVTGYAENAAIRAQFLGTNMAMITKPFSLDVLAMKIDEMVSQRPAEAGVSTPG